MQAIFVIDCGRTLAYNAGLYVSSGNAEALPCQAVDRSHRVCLTGRILLHPVFGLMAGTQSLDLRPERSRLPYKDKPFLLQRIPMSVSQRLRGRVVPRLAAAAAPAW